ncbi:putative polygalacturonase-like [Capsicum annuum]|nr:putative polygalacturonase-like [Capsicum annuum]
MQILIQKLFKNTNEYTTSSHSISKKETVNHQKAKSKEIVLFGICRGNSSRKSGDKSRSRSKNFNIFNILCRKDISKEYFYSTVKLRRVGSYHRSQYFEYCMKMKKENHTRGLSISHKEDSSVTENHVGNTQILPVTDSAPSSSSLNNKDRCSGAEVREKCKGDKAKTISKMKELLRWAAAAKSDKGSKYIASKVFKFRNRAALKSVPDDDQLSNDSPKISFRWDVESCSTTYSAMSMPDSSTKNEQSIQINFASLNSTPVHINQCPKLNWITTDSESQQSDCFLFLVLNSCGAGAMKTKK